MQDKEIIHLYENKDQCVTAAIDKIVVELFNRKAGNEMQSIALFGASPLAGSTTTSIDLAIAMAATGRKILLVDCDVRKAAQYKKLNDSIKDGLADYLLQGEEQTIKLDDIVYNTNVDGLFYVPCGTYTKNSTRVMCSTKMQPLMKEFGEYFDYVIYDLPSISVVPDAQVLFQYVDDIVLLVALGETRKKQIKDAKRKIAPFAEKYCGMIINKISPDMYKRRVKEFDYYLADRRGEQKLGGASTRKKYKKKAETNRRNHHEENK